MKWIYCILACILLFHQTADCQDQRLVTRPNHEDTTVVKVTIILLDLSQVNTNQQQFSANVYLNAKWQDDRLKYKGDSDQGIKKLGFQEAWHPNLEIINLRETNKTLPEELYVTPSGEVSYVQRYLGNFSQPLDLHDFPFDKQTLQIQLVSVDYFADEVKFIQNLEMNILEGAEKFSIPDWDITNIKSTVINQRVIKTLPASNLYLIKIKAKRKTGYYILKVIIPFLLLVMMSWAVFWVSPKSAEVQLQITITSMLTVIAFQFAISQFLPVVSYMTRMDQFVLIATILVFFSIAESLYTAVCKARNQPEKALKIDYYSRILFPLIFFTTSLYIFFH